MTSLMVMDSCSNLVSDGVPLKKQDLSFQRASWNEVGCVCEHACMYAWDEVMSFKCENSKQFFFSLSECVCGA